MRTIQGCLWTPDACCKKQEFCWYELSFAEGVTSSIGGELEGPLKLLPCPCINSTVLTVHISAAFLPPEKQEAAAHRHARGYLPTRDFQYVKLVARLRLHSISISMASTSEKHMEELLFSVIWTELEELQGQYIVSLIGEPLHCSCSVL